MAANDEPIQTDVLILGGGVQGLWLLKDLRREGYNAVLLETETLGGQQTCHSHVYIHQGHVYAAEKLNADDTLVAKLRDTDPIWKAWFAGTGRTPQRENMPSYFGFHSEAALERLKALRSHPEFPLPFDDVDELPPALRGGGTAINKVCSSPEVCLNGQWLVKELSKDLKSCIGKIFVVNSIQASSEGLGPIKVEVSLSAASGDRRTFLSKGLVLTAGAANGDLMRLATQSWDRNIQGVIDTQQEIRKGHMLVVYGGKESSFEPLTGVFPDVGQLFIVSRKSGSEIIWLISDGRSPGPDEPGYSTWDAKKWLPDVVEALARLAPRFFGTTVRDQLRWAVYSAPKAEQGGKLRPPGWCSRVGKACLWVIYPTKLTLAPRMSSDVIADMRKAGIEQGSPFSPQQLVAAGFEPVPEAQETWTKREYEPEDWAAFRERYEL